jgi:tripartite-type tricarboxylate transporter receptor subunit TctC
MTKSRITLAALAATVLLAHERSAAAQANYPLRPIRIIIPYVPGGGTSLMGRLVAQRLTERWGQNAILDNRPGAGGIVGAETLARAQPDGYTLMLTSVSDHLLVSLMQKTPYDPIKDFAPVATVAVAERLLVVNPALPAASLKDLIALAKSKPGQLNYASLGNGSTAHVGTELLCIMTGIKLAHIPYKGGSQAVTDLLAGQVQIYLGSITSMGAFVSSGKLRAIAITGHSRIPALPQVPTFTEAGLPAYDVKLWYGVLAPAGTPAPVLDALSVEIGSFLSAPDAKEKLLGLGMFPFVTGRQEMAPMMKADMNRYAEVIRSARIARE